MPVKDKQDEELMKLVNHKHRPALEELYNRYIKLVYSFVMKFTNGNQEKTKEIVQLVFLRLWTTTSTYDSNKGSFVNWLLTITRNICIDYLRKEKMHANSQEEQPADIEDPVNEIEQRVAFSEIAAAKEELTKPQRKLIDMLYWKGYSLAEIAKMEQEPLGTVKNRLHQALKRLRKHLELGDSK